jgi:hypothetical protein
MPPGESENSPSVEFILHGLSERTGDGPVVTLQHQADTSQFVANGDKGL